MVFPALSALFSNSQVLEGCSHSLKRSEFLQWGIRQRKFCKAIIASFVTQKFQKKKQIYIFGKSPFDFPDIISSCLDVNVSCYSATSELSVCKACYRRLIKFRKASDHLEELKIELKQIYKDRELPRAKHLLRIEDDNGEFPASCRGK